MTATQAIELARRLVFQTIPGSISGESPVQVDIPSIILFDTHNPSASQVRATYKHEICTGIAELPPGLTKYSRNHPLISFGIAHTLHSKKLMLEWKIQPLAPNQTGGPRIPTVQYLRALSGCVDELVDPEERIAYWTTEDLPKLDSGRMKMVENSSHLGIWKPGKVEKVTEWLKEGSS